MREQFTHLDTQVIQDSNVHSDLFIEIQNVRELKARLKKYLKMKRLRASGDPEVENPKPIMGQIEYRFQSTGEAEFIPVQVVDFEEESGNFVLVNERLNIHTQRPRIYIILQGEPFDITLQNLRTTIKFKSESLQYLRVARLIQNELLKRYSHIYMTEDVREKIYKRIGLDLKRSRKRTVMRVVLQVEALYVYAMLKSTLSSQRDDPFIKSMLINFKISMDSPALEIEKQNNKEKSHLPGVEHFKIQAIRRELDKSSVFLTNPRFIQMPSKNRDIVTKAVGDNKLFVQQFDVYELVIAGGSVYKKIKIEELRQEVNNYPLKHKMWVDAQGIIAKYFNALIKTRWADQLATSMWETLSSDFTFSVS